MKCLDCGAKFNREEAERTEYYDLAVCPECNSGHIKIIEKPTNPYTIAMLKALRKSRKTFK